MQDNTADTSAQTIPEDYSAYEKWRDTGELPEAENVEDTSEAAADEDATPEADQDSDPENEEQEQEEKPAGKKGRGFQKRIDQLTAKIRELEAKQVTSVKAEEKPGDASPKPAAAAASAEGKPQSENFETYDAYIEALTDWKAEQRDQAKAAKERNAKVTTEWSSRVEAFKTKHEDFDEVLGAAAFPMSAAMQEAIVTDEQGPAIAYHLAENPEEAKRIAALSPVAAARAIGKLAAKFEGETKAAPVVKQPQASKAPKPPTPVAGAAKNGTADIHDEKLAGDFNAWERERDKGIQRRR